MLEIWNNDKMISSSCFNEAWTLLSNLISYGRI